MTVTLEIPVDESWDPHWVVWPDLLVNPSGLDVKPDLTVNPSDLFVKPDLIVNPSDLVVKPDLNVNPSGLVVKPDLIVNPSDLVIEPDLIIKLLDPGVSMSQVLDREVSSGTEIVAGRNFELSEWRNTVADVDGLDEGGHPVLEIGESVAKVLVRLSCLETSIKTIVLLVFDQHCIVNNTLNRKEGFSLEKVATSEMIWNRNWNIPKLFSSP